MYPAGIPNTIAAISEIIIASILLLYCIFIIVHPHKSPTHEKISSIHYPPISEW
jgi:hypothetical protein